MKKVISTSKAPQAVGPYSQAIEANGMVFISGQIALDPASGTIVEGGIEAQTEQVMNNLKAVLEAAGCTLTDVVKCTCLLSDMDNFKAMNGIYASYFQKDPPARAAFAVKTLPLNVLVEIDAIAVKD